MKYIKEIEQKFAATVHIKCKTVVNSKIEKLVRDGSDKLQVISDFDRTLSCSEYNNEPTKNSFRIFDMCESLSEDYKQKAKAVYLKYQPIEDNTQITIAQKLPIVDEWWHQCEQLFKGLSFQYEDLEKSIKKANVKLRDGCVEALTKLCSEKIPLVVLSAGLGDVVELILKSENLLTNNVTVISNFLDITKDDDGKSTIHGYKDKKLIHIFNKNETARVDDHKNVKKNSLGSRHNVILLGDSLGDANMDGGISYNTVLRIGFLNNSLAEYKDGHLQQYKLAFDIVLVQDQTMGLLNYLLDEIFGKNSTVNRVEKIKD